MRAAAGLSVAILLAGFSAATAAADGAGAARQAAHRFLVAHARGLGNDVRVDVDAPDPRLHLAPCRQALIAGLAPGVRPLGNTTVTVHCPGPSPWSVNLPARVQVYGEVLVTTRALARGTTLAGDDLAPRRQDLAAAAPGALTDPAQALGRKLRYPLGPGAVLNAGVLEATPVVRRGQSVTIVSGTGGIEVRARGEALGDGGPGQSVRVRNHQTGRVLNGTIEAPGLVRVAL